MKGQVTITGEEIFPAYYHTFSLGASSSGYTLNYSTNYDTATQQGDWDAWDESTPANEQCIVNGAEEYMYFKLVDNTDTITCSFKQKWCPCEH